MGHVETASHMKLNGSARTPAQINAALFSPLAEILVWGQQHTDISAAYPEFDCLLKRAAAALAIGGMIDQPASGIVE